MCFPPSTEKSLPQQPASKGLWRPAILMACVLAGWSPVAVHAQTAPASSTSRTDSIVFPSYTFQGASMEEVLTYMRVKTRDLAPKGQELQFIAGEGVLGTGAQVTFQTDNITLTDALEVLSRFARVDVRLLDDEVFLTKSTTKKPPFPNGAINDVLRRQAQAILENVYFRQVSFAEAVEFARVKGRDVDPKHQNVSIVVDPALSNLNAKITLNVQPCTVYELLTYLAALADGTVGVTGTTFYLQPAGQLPPKVEMTNLPELGPAGKVKFPTVTFQDATILEALDFLTAKSRDLDLQKKGVRVIIDSASADAAGAITLDSRDISGEKALRQIAMVAGLEMYQLKEAVLLRHPTKAVSAGFR